MPPNADPHRILIVDDEPDMLAILGTLVESFGNYTPLCASDGYSASYMVLKNDFDLILLDIMMPGIDGIEVCKTLRKQPKTAGIPIIMVSAVSDMDVVVEAHRCGANDYLLKPFDSKVLRNKIESILQPKNNGPLEYTIPTETVVPDAGSIYVIDKKNMPPTNCKIDTKTEIKKTPATLYDKKNNPYPKKKTAKIFKEQILATINEISFLPIMPETLMTMKKNAGKAANDLKEPISSDIGFTYNTLQVANSAFYSPKQPVTNIFWAISVIGERTITDNIRRMIQAKQLVSEELRSHMGKGFLSAYLSRAFAARFIADHEQGANPEDAYTCVLLQYMGKFALLNYFEPEYSKVIEDCDSGKGALSKLEQEYIGLTHYDVAYALMRKGTMPAILKDFFSYFISDKRNKSSEVLKLFQIAHLADYCSSILGFTYGQEPFLPETPDCINSYNRFGEYVHKLLTQVVQQVEYAGQLLDLPGTSVSHVHYNNERCILIGKGNYTSSLRLLLENIGLQVMSVEWDNLRALDEIDHKCIVADASGVSRLRIEKYCGSVWHSKGILIGSNKTFCAKELFPACIFLPYPLRRDSLLSNLSTVIRK